MSFINHQSTLILFAAFHCEPLFVWVLYHVSVYNLTSSLFTVTAGVHDSYWTHAGDVEKMNRLLREKFVELYEQPVLENVSPV